MRGIVLAGGKGTRLYPLTRLFNKHLLPVGKYPMIHYSVKKLEEAGVRDILLITGKESAGFFAEYFGDGSGFGVRLTYRIQEQAGGIAEALSLGEDFVRPGEKFVVLLGDNLFEDSLAPYVEDFRKQPRGARVLLKEVQDPSRFGVPIILKDQIIWIEEKPPMPKSSYCVVGVYMYDSGVFDVIRRIRPSDRGELEITDVNNVYASEGTLYYNVLSGWWTDAGTFPSFYEANRNVLMRTEEDA